MLSQSYAGTGRDFRCMTMYEQPHQKQLTFWPEEIPALRAPELAGLSTPAVPICPDTSLQWSDDYAHDGWSARMFLHQMIKSLRPAWSYLDTERLLSCSTLGILPVRVAGGSSLSDALEKASPDSAAQYLNPQMVVGLARRSKKRKRPLQHVLLRIPTGWRRRTVIVSSQGEGFEFSLPKSVKVFKDSPEAGLLDWLRESVAVCLGTR